MDEVIFEEFKGTGNMELRLDRGLADRRIFPAIDVITSGTRKEELLLDPAEAPFVWGVRRILHGIDNPERAMDMLIKGLKQTTQQHGVPRQDGPQGLREGQRRRVLGGVDGPRRCRAQTYSKSRREAALLRNCARHLHVPSAK